jgi:hypothetical protein
VTYVVIRIKPNPCLDSEIFKIESKDMRDLSLAALKKQVSDFYSVAKLKKTNISLCLLSILKKVQTKHGFRFILVVLYYRATFRKFLHYNSVKIIIWSFD